MISAAYTQEVEVPTIAIESKTEATEARSPEQLEEENVVEIIDENNENVTTIGEKADWVKLNVTNETVNSNVTKVNCLLNKEYGPVEVNNLLLNLFIVLYFNL